MDLQAGIGLQEGLRRREEGIGLAAVLVGDKKDSPGMDLGFGLHCSWWRAGKVSRLSSTCKSLTGLQKPLYLPSGRGPGGTINISPVGHTRTGITVVVVFD